MSLLFTLGARRGINGVLRGKFELRADELVTHGVIVGMTGSGKTGLLTVLVEEALRAQIPVLLIDVLSAFTGAVSRSLAHRAKAQLNLPNVQDAHDAAVRDHQDARVRRHVAHKPIKHTIDAPPEFFERLTAAHAH